MRGSFRLGWPILALLAAPVFAQVVPGFYIVELTGTPTLVAAAKANRREAIEARRGRVQARQAAAREALQALDAEVISSIENVANALVVRVDDSRAGELANQPGVSRVYPAREAHMELDHAIPLHKVPGAWELIGGSSRAGVGVKIGLIDSGIETSHPAFDDPTLPALEGYPKTRSASDEAALSRKVIVVRDYEGLIDSTLAPDPRDHSGHGTAVAMAAAGMPVTGPYGLMSGVAQKAYLGIYKVFAGSQGNTRDDVVIKALDDAVADGMDIVNISLGVEPAQRNSDDLLVEAVERASAAGVLVIKSAGNSGPTPNTLTSPASAPSGITVGAQWNDRDFEDPAVVVGGKSFRAVPGSGLNSKDPIEGLLVDVQTLDQTGQACSALPADSLAGKIAFIIRGGCLFEEKLLNAGKAGAVAGLVYSHADSPDPVIMAVGSATLPAVMLSNSDGVAVKAMLAADPATTARLRFTLEGVAVSPLRLGSFSSRGPSTDYSIKPDLVAAGVNILTAAESIDPDGEVYSPGKFIILDGTSFSSPLVAGAAAVLKGARPGLTVSQYRSLLVNSAPPLAEDPSAQNPAQQTGTGMLNLENAIRSTVSVDPVSVSFGAGDATAAKTREIAVTNLDKSPDVLTLTVEPLGDGPAASLSVSQMNLGAGDTGRATLSFGGTSLTAGEYQGIVRIRGTRSGVDARIPYWFAAPTREPKYIFTVNSSGATPSLYMRAVDSTGVVIGDVRPTVTVVTGSGTMTGAITSVDSVYPGFWRVRLQLGTQGATTFRIAFGDLTKDVTLRPGS